MDKKTKIIVIIRDFLLDLVAIIVTCIRIVLLSKKCTCKSPDSKKSKAIILGNGPSLSSSIDEISKDKLAECLLICVNHFGETELYKKLQPEVYVLNAPEMWMDDVEEYHFRKGEKLFKSISEKTEWPITVYIPSESKKYHRWKRQLEQNPNISICYFNATPIEGFDTFKFLCFELGLGMPRPHNVLIPSLMAAIALKMKEIYLFGADHSWMKDLWVDEDNNVLLSQKHFYDPQTKARTMDNLGKGQRKLHEVLTKFVHAFEGYFVVDQYSRKKNISIINSTPNSMIDAFKRGLP